MALGTDQIFLNITPIFINATYRGTKWCFVSVIIAVYFFNSSVRGHYGRVNKKGHGRMWRMEIEEGTASKLLSI